MSLFGALFTGVSALDAQSSSMGIISNNIANVNTVGYKASDASFSSLVTDNSTAGSYSSGGVLEDTASTINTQGTLEQTSSPTDLAISGNGFFVVKDGVSDTSDTLYTRAGSFTENSDGYLTNTAGLTLYGWPLTNGDLPAADSDISSLEPVNVSFLGGQTSPTANVDLSVNVNSSTAAQGTFSRSVTVYDSLGTAQNLNVTFTKTSTNNAWTMAVTDGSGNNLLPPNPNDSGANVADVTFNSDGTIDTVTYGNPVGASVAVDTAPASTTYTYGTPSTLTATGSTFYIPGVTTSVSGTTTTSTYASSGTAVGINWGDGSANQHINLNLASITQFDSANNVVSITQDGAALGLRTGVSVDANGIVSATFSNGTSQQIFQLPIATFANPDGLQEVSGNAYQVTNASGDYNLREAGLSGAGTVAPSSLEQSNVDLATEFSNMIVTQRAYSAGTKVISTVDQMLQDLLQTT